MPQRWPWTLGGFFGQFPYDFATAPRPHAVVLNLGENDFSDGHGANASFVAAFTAAYVAFVANVTAAYGAGPGTGTGGATLPVFATIAPHEQGQSAGILPAVAALEAAGYPVTFLTATVPLPPALPDGCGGHPGPTIHAAAAARAAPAIAATRSWGGELGGAATRRRVGRAVMAAGRRCNARVAPCADDELLACMQSVVGDFARLL
jgi:hypothetical protein